ncbi:MAG: GntR family transcriptional regulator [Candidatus Hinthialibacter antarcticus]|nr:GntR family transcriptional regulator [Candidatus Hinthialibacter antarcticus]
MNNQKNKPKSKQNKPLVENSDKERLPLHRQIRDTLRQEIFSGQRTPYSEMPPEQELAARFQTSRMTVRQAINALEIEGLLEKQQGRRTIVCPPKEVEPIFALPHDNQIFFRGGKTITYTLLTQELVPPTNLVREKLQLPWTVEKVILISRIRHLHEVPISVYSTYFPYSRCPDLLKEDLTGRSLVYVMRNEYGLTPFQMTHELEVLSADEEASEILNIRERTPIMKVESVEFDEDGAPFSFNLETFRADRYRFKIMMSNPALEPKSEKKETYHHKG